MGAQGGEETLPRANADDADTGKKEDSKPADNQPPPVKNQQPSPPAFTEPPKQQILDLCPQNSFVGWHASSDCKEYYKCDNGVPGAIEKCSQSLKFDKVRNKCYSEQLVNSFCYGPPLDTAQDSQQGGRGDGRNDSSASRDLCKEGYPGWITRLGCREYYWCDQGRADDLHDCDEDLLFDLTLELCNFVHLVHCVDKDDPTTLTPPAVPPPMPRPAPRPMPRPTPRPSSRPMELSTSTEDTTGSNHESNREGAFGDYSRSNTAAPSPFQGQSETPPWLMNTIMENNLAPVSSKLIQFWSLLIPIIFVVLC